MDTKIQALTDKIYQEGVEKGKEEANKIIAEATSRKETILSEANDQSKQIIDNAKKEAAEIKKNTEAEIKLFANQSVEALKSEITNLITGKLATNNVKAAAADPDFMRKVILEIAKNWKGEGEPVIGASDSEGMKKYVAGNAADLLQKGLKIEKVNGKPCSFTIAPADGSYKLQFGEKEFIDFFKEYLRPQLTEMLFGHE